MSEEIKDMDTPAKPIKRRKDGTFAKGRSGNAAGRPKGTKNKYAKAKLENMLNSMGVNALKQIEEIAKKAVAQGQLQLGMKCYMIIFDKYYALTIHNDRSEIQEQKDKAKELAQEEEGDTQEYAGYVVKFPTFQAVEA